MYQTFVFINTMQSWGGFTDLVSKLSGTLPSDFFLPLLLQLSPITQNSDLLELMPKPIPQKYVHLVHANLDLLLMIQMKSFYNVNSAHHLILKT